MQKKLFIRVVLALLVIVMAVGTLASCQGRNPREQQSTSSGSATGSGSPPGR